MFGHPYKLLTEASNHYIDWSRTGELVTSQTHHYTTKELQEHEYSEEYCRQKAHLILDRFTADNISRPKP